jgi:hypothetical protein
VAEAAGSGVAPREEPADEGIRSEYLGIGLVCALTLLCLLQPGSAFMALLMIPFVAAWFPYQLAKACTRPARWRTFGTKVALLAATAVIFVAVQAACARTAREAAEQVRQAVTHYRSEHGAWPPSLKAAGVVDMAPVHRWRIDYKPDDGTVFYRSVFNTLDIWHYGPTDKDWVFKRD